MIGRLDGQERDKDRASGARACPRERRRRARQRAMIVFAIAVFSETHTRPTHAHNTPTPKPNTPTQQTGFVQQHKARLAREIASLRRQAEALNAPSTYAKCAKLQRLANAKEQELAALQQDGERDARARVAAAMAAVKVRALSSAVRFACVVGGRRKADGSDAIFA